MKKCITKLIEEQVPANWDEIKKEALNYFIYEDYNENWREGLPPLEEVEAFLEDNDYTDYTKDEVVKLRDELEFSGIKNKYLEEQKENIRSHVNDILSNLTDSEELGYVLDMEIMLDDDELEEFIQECVYDYYGIA
jgi:hypothetical protein